ncbi:MAG: hypothetical protein WKH97_16580 [Casimicrobiaceae bacterium]
MMNWLRNLHIHRYRCALIVVVALTVAGCATTPLTSLDPVKQAPPLDRALEERILALNPASVSDQDVQGVLAKGPAPRIMLLHGGIYPVHLVMNSFGEFLVGMGYPEAMIRDPGSGDWSYSPYSSTARLAGILAWHYERDGVRPMIIGHSQGGLYAIRILKELAGQYSDRIAIWNPLTDAAENRTTVIDPLTGRERPVVGLSAAYASALGAGGWALVLPNQWENFANLRRIPDTVDEFTGYFIGLDFFALSFPGNPLDSRYENNGTANVRNVVLPAAYNHVTVPVTHDLPHDVQTRNRINAYVPGRDAEGEDRTSDVAGGVTWAADVWYSIKKHWVLEAQRLIRARRATLQR